MTTIFKKYQTPIFIFLILALCISVWLFSSVIWLGLIIVLSGLIATSYMIVRKQRESYLQGKISRTVLIRNVCIEITGILIALILAGLLGRTFAEMLTQSMSNDLIRLIAGIVIGLLVGIAVGAFIKWGWTKLMGGFSR